MEDLIEEIREKINIVDFISNYIELKRTGSYYKGLCPFHQERNPSFFVSPQKQIFKCFGCNVGGDVITFYMKIENLSFKEAVKNLCEKLGIDYEYSKSKEIKPTAEIKKILDINRIALNFFKKHLKNNKPVLDYLFNRGLKEKTIDIFDLGYAPRGSHLRDYLFTLGFSLEDLKKAGLINEKEEDKFQGRIIIPLIDHNKKLIGFTGRIFPESDYGPKYLNSPETILFKKSKFIYGLVYALEELSKEKELIITEGQFDVMLAYQYSVKNIAAISGTSITLDHINIIKKYTQNIALAFDNDEAGFKAELKAALLAFSKNINVYKIVFQEGKDLADFFLKNENNLNKIKKMYYIDYILEWAQNNLDLNVIDGKWQFLNIALPLLKQIDNIKQAYYIQKISEMIKINESFIIKELEKINYPYILNNQETETPSYLDNSKNRMFLLIERFLSLVLLSQKFDIIENIKPYTEPYKDLITSFINSDNENSSYFNEIIKLRSFYEENLKTNIDQELLFLEKEIKKEFYKDKIQKLKQIVQNNKDLNIEEILKEIKTYTEKLKETL
jgi:DNA primase